MSDRTAYSTPPTVASDPEGKLGATDEEGALTVVAGMLEDSAAWVDDGAESDATLAGAELGESAFREGVGPVLADGTKLLEPRGQ